LRSGGLVAMPTETVYGLAADATNEAAVRSIFAAKGRPVAHPVIVHLADASALARWADAVPDAAQALARTFWPGALTIVLKRRSQVSDLITGGQDTVGLRCPAHPWAQALLKAFGGAVAAPSANRFGRISPTTAQHVIDDLGVKPEGAVDVVLDGGPCPVGIESTIVDLSRDRPRLLRPGVISRDQLEAVLGMPVLAADADAPRASGGLEKHYAPKTPLEVIPVSDVANRIAGCGSEEVAVLAPAGLLLAGPNLRRHLLASDDPAEYARSLYDHLRRLDASGAARLIVAEPPSGPEWEAVRDRLNRASAGGAA
jgi:L-threonylcarbamoyladenylate synthase